MNDEHILAGEYPLGSLTDAEAHEFETHLATCPDCREEVADMREIAVQLSEAVATDPPPRLRASILDTIAHTTQDASAPASVQSRQGTGTGTDTAPATPSVPSSQSPAGRHLAVPGTVGSSSTTTSNVVPLQRVSRTTWVTSVLAAAAVLAAIALGGWAIHNRNDARDATAQTQQLTQVLSANDVRTVSGNFGKSGAGTVVVSASQGRALLVTAGLAPLPDGKVYQAWTITKVVVPAGTFTPTGAQTVVSLPSAAVDATQVAVTVEPAGGSKQPTTTPVFAVRVPKA